MSVYCNVTEQDLINLRKLAEQQKNQRALIIKNRGLKQARGISLAESLSPITKKLEEVKESTQKLGDVLNDSNPENENNQDVFPVEIDSEVDNIQSNMRALSNSNKFFSNMKETLGTLMNSKNSLKLLQDTSGRASL